MKSFNVEHRVAVVTGGSSGIGLETAALLLDQGARVAICGRSAGRLRDAAQDLQQRFPAAELLAHGGDVLDAASMTGFAAAVTERFGTADMLICNAGQGRVASLQETTEQDWLDETRLKLFGVLNPLKAFLDLLHQSGIASLTCVNSLLALQPEPHMIATSAARAALLNMTHSLAHEYAAQGIRVNSILLGMIESGQWRRRFAQRSEQEMEWSEWTAGIAARRGIPMGRMGHPQEPAQALLFLASPLSSYTTGSCLDVSGGFNRHL